jgi:hypothetical protein
MLSPEAEFPGERMWEQIAQKNRQQQQDVDADGRDSERSELFSAPCSPTSPEFPGQKAWERVALLRWMTDGGIDSANFGALRSLGVKRVEDLAFTDKETVVRTLGLTPTKETAFLDRLPRSPVHDEPTGSGRRMRDASWYVGSPCGADGREPGCTALMAPTRQPRFGCDESPDANELLLQAAVAGNEQQLGELLATPGVDPNFSREDETTALMFAAMKGHRDCVELLLARGASIDRAVREPRLCVSGWTAFHFAAEADRTNCAVALLHAGCDWQLQQQPSLRSSAQLAEMGSAELPEMSSSVRAAIAECELTQRLCRARQRLVFARGSSSVAAADHPAAAAACPLLLLAPDLLEECCAHLRHLASCTTPFARRVQAAAQR